MGIGMRTAFILAIITGILATGSFSNFIIQPAYAQSDLLIDLDGIISKLKGGDEFQDVFPGAPLTPFPPPVFPMAGSRVGIDFFDQTNPGFFDPGDDLHAEDTDNCPTSLRDGIHNNVLNGKIDCVILDDPAFPANPLINGRVVDCDLETGGSPSELYTFPCQVPNLTFYDEPEDDGVPNGHYDLGEDIVLDLDGDGVYDEVIFVAGTLSPIDTTMVLVAGTQMTAAWMIPVIISGIGFAIVITRKF